MNLENCNKIQLDIQDFVDPYSKAFNDQMFLAH